MQFMNSAGGQSEKKREREKDNSNLGENLEAAQSVKVSRRNRRGRNMSPLHLSHSLWNMLSYMLMYMIFIGLPARSEYPSPDLFHIHGLLMWKLVWKSSFLSC